MWCFFSFRGSSRLRKRHGFQIKSWPKSILPRNPNLEMQSCCLQWSTRSWRNSEASFRPNKINSVSEIPSGLIFFACQKLFRQHAETLSFLIIAEKYSVHYAHWCLLNKIRHAEEESEVRKQCFGFFFKKIICRATLLICDQWSIFFNQQTQIPCC